MVSGKTILVEKDCRMCNSSPVFICKKMKIRFIGGINYGRVNGKQRK